MTGHSEGGAGGSSLPSQQQASQQQALEPTALAHVRYLSLSQIPQCADSLAQAHHAQWSALMLDWSLPEAQRELREHAQSQPFPCTWVALPSGQTGADDWLGSVSLVASDARQFEPLGPWLCSLYVRPERRGQGIGKQLIELAMAIAHTLGFKQLYVFTEHAGGLFSGCGFVPLRSDQLFGVPVSIMRWQRK